MARELRAEAGKVIDFFVENAREHERTGEMLECIGAPRLFELTGLPFTKYHIDDWRGSRATLNASAQIRF